MSDARTWWQLTGGAAHDARHAYERRNSQELVSVSATHLLQLMRARARARATVIDVGCGDGTLLRQLADSKAADRYIGIDPNSPDVAGPEFEFVHDSAERLHKLVSGLDGDVTVVATLTIGLWHEPEELLRRVLADHAHVGVMFISDIIRPTSDSAWAIWRSFALNEEELRYLDDHGSVLLTAARWARFASDLAHEFVDIEVHVETFDIRTPGIAVHVWPADEIGGFVDHLEAASAPQGIILHTSRLHPEAQGKKRLENGAIG